MNRQALRGERFLTWFLLILLSLIWGSSFILIKRGLEVYSPGEVGALRIITAALVLVPLSFPKLKTLNARQLKWLFVSGMAGSFVPAFLFAKAQTQLSSSLTGVLNALTPIFVLLVGISFFSAKLKLRDAVGIVLGFMGTAILILSGSEGHVGDINYYAFFVIIATFCYGLNLNVIKHFFVVLKPIDITSISLLLVMPFAAVYLFGATDFVHKLGSIDGAWKAFGYVSLLGIMGTAIALILFNNLVKMTSPVFTSMVTYLIPIVAVMWGLLDGEVMYAMHFVGMAAIIAGVVFANRKKA
jgi:drug/metabolite transporter (DMT)-like permease